MMARRDIPIIVLWYGPIANIPVNWHICDGNAGTPDLRNRFIVGAGDTYAVNDVGGDFDHTHTFTGDGHFHTMPFVPGIGLGAPHDPNTDPEPEAGESDVDCCIAPYHSLVYIMWTGVYYP